MPEKGEEKSCALCDEDDIKGTCTWTTWESEIGFGDDAGGGVPDPTQAGEWQCDQNDQHNHCIEP